MSVQILRGPNSRVNTITPGLGEPLWVTDTFEFRVGDGTTPGGIPLDFVKTFGAIAAGEVCLWQADNSIEGESKAVFLAGQATETFVNNGLTGKLDTGAKAADSFLADDAGLLDGQLPTFYLNTSLRSSSISSTSTTNVATSQATKTAYDRGTLGINNAATAQAKANQGVSDALTAQTTANQGVTDAAAALAVANGKIAATNYATSSVGGTVKARLSGTTLYLTINGTNA